jgi:hypothetical protein
MNEIFKSKFPYLRVGLLWLRLSSFFAGGLGAVYHREVTRNALLKSAPVETSVTGLAELHLLTGGADWINAMWALKSFYRASQEQFPLVVHDDGTLPASARETLGIHFPQARIIGRAQADVEMRKFLSGHPRCWNFRQSNYLAQKVFDLQFYLRSPRMLLFDSDLLFFRRPDALIRRLVDPSYRVNSVNRNWALYGYALSQESIRKRFGVDVCDAFNSGLGVLQTGVLNVDWIEEWLGDDELQDGHPHRVEQTLIAMCCCKTGCELLPGEYDVYDGPTDFSRPVRHYIRPVRPLMYSEGIPFLMRCYPEWSRGVAETHVVSNAANA